jgi:MFS family permease
LSLDDPPASPGLDVSAGAARGAAGIPVLRWAKISMAGRLRWFPLLLSSGGILKTAGICRPRRGACVGDVAGAVGDLQAAEAEYEAEIERNLPRNYVANMAHGLLGQTGFRLINAPTFVPAYIFQLSGSEVAVGLALGGQALGAALSSILGATLIEHRKRVLPMGMLVGWGMRGGVLGLALSGFFLPDRWALICACFFLTVFGLFNGVQNVIFNYLMAKVIPLRLRGRLSGLRNFVAGVTASIVAYLGGQYFVGRNVLGNGYAATFLLAFILTSIGLTMLMLVREPEPPEVRRRSSFLSRIGEIPALLGADRALSAFYAAASLASLGALAVPFYVLYAGHSIRLSGATLAVLSTAMLVSQTVTNLFWGALADRAGSRIVFLLGEALWAVSTLLLMGVHDIVGLAIVFAGLGAGQGGFQNASQILVLEFGSRTDLPMRIAVLNALVSLMAAIGPLAGGIMAEQFSYEAVFCFSMIVQALSVAIVVLAVDEPRRRKRTP